MTIDLSRTKITIVRRQNHTDHISFELPDSLALDVHGPHIGSFDHLWLELRVTHGRAEEALRALGCDPVQAELISVGAPLMRFSTP